MIQTRVKIFNYVAELISSLKVCTPPHQTIVSFLTMQCETLAIISFSRKDTKMNVS